MLVEVRVRGEMMGMRREETRNEDRTYWKD